MPTTVVKYHDVKQHWNGFEQRWDDDRYVYIGRTHGRSKQPASVFANPFKVGQHGTREEVIEKYRQYLYGRPDLLRQLWELKDKTLVCWCSPQACHGDVLAELLNYKSGISVQKETGIEWTHVPGYVGATANPVRGCEHGCKWEMPDGKIANCYAEDVAHGIAQSAYPNGFQHISFHPEVLFSIRRRKKPTAFFIDSMSDLLGKGVHKNWIQAVLDTMEDCPQHLFFILTKNPPRLKQFTFPENCWVGVSAPPSMMFGKTMSLAQQEKWFENALSSLGKATVKGRRWVSIEPLSWDCSAILGKHWDVIDWAVIGAASSGARTYQPDKDVFQRVLASLEGKPVFYKGNLDREMVGVWREEFYAPALGDDESAEIHAEVAPRTYAYNGQAVDQDEFEFLMRLRQGLVDDTPLLPATSSYVERVEFYPRRELRLDEIAVADVTDYLRTIPTNSVHTVVTSPPYFALRDYQEDGQIGFEETVEQFINKLVGIFHEVRRVLREDGVCWLNISDTAVSAKGRYRRKTIDTRINAKAMPTRTIDGYGQGLKDKDLYLVPQQLLIALQRDGWWVRSDVIWHKRNVSPDSANDRLARAYEHIFQLTKKAHYWYDWTADTKPYAEKTQTTWGIPYTPASDDESGLIRSANFSKTMQIRRPNLGADGQPLGVRLKDVWNDLKQVNYSGAHYATFPVSLPDRCIKLSCPPIVCTECGTGYTPVTSKAKIDAEFDVYDGSKSADGELRSYHQVLGNTKKYRQAGGSHDNPFPDVYFEGYRKNCDCDCVETHAGIVLDPFMGAGTTGLAASRLGRHYIGCDLNPDYVTQAEKRISDDIEERKQGDPFEDTVHVIGQREIVQMSMFGELSN